MTAEYIKNAILLVLIVFFPIPNIYRLYYMHIIIFLTRNLQSKFVSNIKSHTLYYDKKFRKSEICVLIRKSKLSNADKKFTK
ncbi:MAG: hypothetical protein MSIBF_03620 [Candidatus Altiarchaeales archaeon IMC4]|nr:MAG: hypothetical protein MSIBF_03620 [Candidatus Altiarchaeales archaeon IMC4]